MRYQRSPNTVTADVDGGVLVLHTTTGNVHRFNDSAAFVWKQLEAPMTVEALSSTAGVQFADAGGSVEDITMFLNELVEHDLALRPDTAS